MRTGCCLSVASKLDLAVEIAIALCKRFEGCRLSPYLCSAGVPTIGYGATFYEDGTRVTLKDPAITHERAINLLKWQVKSKFLPAVTKLCPGLDDPERLAALIDFTFNLGVSNFKASTLRKRVNEQNWPESKVQIKRWNKAGGRVLRGLTIRREAEAVLL